MRVDILPAHELKPGEVDRWRAAHAAGPDVHPILSPDYVLAVGGARDTVRVAVMDHRGARGWLAYETGPRGDGRPAGHGLTDLVGLTCEPGFHCDPGELMRAGGLNVLRYTRPTDAPWPVLRGLRHGRYELGGTISPVIDLSKGFEAFLADCRRRSRKHIPELLRRGRRVRREHDVRVEHHVNDAELVRLMLTWKQERIRATGHPVHLRAVERDVDLVRRVAQLDGPTARGCLTVLRIDDQPAAFHLGVHDDHTMAGVMIAHGPGFERHSPGSLVALEAVEHAAHLGLRAFDCGSGDQAYKTALATGSRHLTEGLLWCPGPRGAAGLARHAGELAAREVILRHPRLRAAVRDGLRAYAARRGT